MARPLRIQFPGALYHVTSRGDRRENIFLGDHDRYAWLDILAKVCARLHWIVHAYCQMGNHYHLVIETLDANLARGMRELNGQYTQRFNFHHEFVGHLFQGRYHAILIQRDAYLLELSRYVVLNPVRAGLVGSPGEWPWSSYPMMINAASAPTWLNTEWLLGQFAAERLAAISRYREFVLDGTGLASPLGDVRHQLAAGDDEFLWRCRAEDADAQDAGISRAQKKGGARTLHDYRRDIPDPHLAMAQAYLSGLFTMSEIALHFDVHYKTVSRAIRKLEAKNSTSLKC
jgi:REP element-mobilizing transposase RayT